jgi:hypothetical protein
MFVIEDGGEHYGQLVVYYRANNMVAPASAAIRTLKVLD